MLKELRDEDNSTYNHLIINHLPGWGTSKSGVALRILAVAPTEGDKCVALKVGETAVSHLNLLHAPVTSKVLCSDFH